MVGGRWWKVRGIFWGDWRMEVGRAGNGGNCGNGGNRWIDGGGTRCGKELTAWLGGDCDATDPAWCCGTGLQLDSLACSFIWTSLLTFKNMMQGHEWNADVSFFEVTS